MSFKDNVLVDEMVLKICPVTWMVQKPNTDFKKLYDVILCNWNFHRPSRKLNMAILAYFWKQMTL